MSRDSGRFRWLSDATITDIVSVAAVEPLGPAAWQKLVAAYPSLQATLAAPQAELEKVIGQGQAEALKSRSTETSRVLSLLKAKNIQVLKRGDDNYPPLLAEINDPPLWLFYRGNLAVLERPTLTVVGTRKPSGYAKTAAESLLTELLVSNTTIISGLAYGIDKIAHQRSLSCQSPAVAVLAGGLDAIYPVDHTNLADEIIRSGGLLLSEYPPLSRPRPYRFPVRNRIVAGLSPLTLVVEAALKSGSLTTAKSALDYNRDIFAVPGDITRPNAQGTNFLIGNGATLLHSAEQLHEYYGLKGDRISPNIDKALQELLNLLSPEAQTLDQLAVVTGQPIEVLLGLITQLELLGLLYQPKAGYYLRK